MKLTPELIELVFPQAVEWIEEMEGRILAEGVPLNEDQVLLAQKMSIEAPQRVRLLRVHEIPLPEDDILSGIAQSAGLISAYTAGMTFRYGILIRADCWENVPLLAHELVHVSQYERLGGIEGFLRPYIQECLFGPGYPHGPMELEAEEKAHEVLRH